MHEFLIIALFVVVFTRESFGAPLLGESPEPARVVALSLVPLVVLWLGLWVWIRGCTRAMDRRGSVRAIRRAEDGAAAFRWAVLLAHAGNVFAIGLLDLVRRWIGDVVLIDELCVLAIPVVAIGAMHWAMYPVERRIREAVLFRRLEEGRPVHPFPGRWRYTWASFRQSVLFMGAPLTLILAWGQLSARAFALAGVEPEGALAVGVQMLGVVGVLALSPPIMRRMWNAAPIGAGPLREGLEELCQRHRVRVRSILVWQTGGTIVNAAVLGLLARLRYIVVSDALIELLDEREVEAVAAHEIGHVRRRHVLWLGIAALGSVLVISAPVGFGTEAVLRFTPLGSAPALAGAVNIASMIAVFAGVLVVLGLVSRRFEWQADAFAAQHLSGMTPERRGVVIDAEAAGTMSRALGRVARLNGIDPGKFTWRHGSIRERQRRLASIVGRPADRLRADREARGAKAMALLAFALGGLAMLAQVALLGV